MSALKDELYAVPAYEWRHVPFTVSHHLWRLRWYRRDDGCFFFAFVSPKGRSYSFFVERGRVSYADVDIARGETIASYWDVWGDSPERMDAVIRLTPKHILDRLFVLLDAIR